MKKGTSSARLLAGGALWVAVVAGTACGRDWQQTAKITSDQPYSNEFFGETVSLSGNVAAIGTLDYNGGHAYIFEPGQSGWNLAAKLSNGLTPARNFGCSVAVDGDTVVVGAREELGGGAAYVYRRSGSGWAEEARLTPTGMQAGNYFGTSVAVHGEFAMVSAPGAEYGDSLAGEAFLFHYSAGLWSQVAKLAVPDSRHLGIQTSLTEGYGLLGSCSEAAYVFAYNDQGVTQTSVLRGSDSLAGDYFGRNGIAIDGNWAVAAAPQHDEKGQNSGSAYVFHLEGGNWTQTQELTASNAATDSYFGANASIKGGLLVVGADYTVPGSAYVFQNNGTTWAETARIQAGDGIDHDYFGWAVSTDGRDILVGAFAEKSAGLYTGAAYVFEIPEPATLSLLAVLALSSTLRLRPKGACRSGAGWR